MSIDSYAIAFIGLGEAASTIISGWGNNRANQIQAFDIKLQSDHTKEEIIARASKLNIQIKFSLKELIRDADLIFSTVTADQALSVAKKVSMHLKKGSFFNYFVAFVTYKSLHFFGRQ